MSRLEIVRKLALVLGIAFVLGLAGSQIEFTATTFLLHDRYYVVSFGAAPLVFLAVLLVGVTVLAKAASMNYLYI